ncbi:mandelate racemase/muconate lactonizing enzyme family protein [Acidisphaera sp. L21]|uniref:mandelate racemase/muconate lactonizing enzyme family protein n=1 Tax=Acidisphaera sp. L21 TaxID=1641851 RepID=UPI00131DAFB8|nr:mandelate racemase/muconate lactonizing enzyme family protein [Acidisphaera sp. L21]
MKISGFKLLHADAGFCNAHFLGLETTDGVIGWSEFAEHTGTAGLSGVVTKLCELVVGMDPMGIERIAAFLRGRTFQAAGGMNQHAIAAIVNALFDIKGKALGVPVHALFGGTLRTRVPVYWSRCGTNRIMHSELMQKPPVRTFNDVRVLGAEARERGFTAIKTDAVSMAGGQLSMVRQGMAMTPGYPELNLEPETLKSIVGLLSAFREGAGPDVQLMFDVNCHFRTEGVLKIIRALESFDLLWFEFDILSPQSLSLARRAAHFPIASLETVYGRQGLRPYLEAAAVDVTIIDIMWNGYLEAIKMADLCAAYDVNAAPHAYSGGGLGDIMSAHFAAAVPNVRIMEIDIDEVPWKWDFLSDRLTVTDGHLAIPQAPGWGVEVDESAIARRPVHSVGRAAPSGGSGA